MEHILANTRIKVLLMTGTPEPLRFLLQQKKDNYTVFDCFDKCINVVPKKIVIIEKKTAINYIRNLSDDEKTIYYSNSAQRIVKGKKSLVNQLCDNDSLNRKLIAISMSETRATEHESDYTGLKKLCLETKDYIVQKNKLPEDKKVLLTTSTLKEGINIKDESIKVAFIESHLLSDIQQFAGRVRDGLDTLYVIADASQNDVSDENINLGRMELIYDIKGALKWINEYQSEYIENGESVLYQITDYEDKNLYVFKEFYSGEWSLAKVGSKVMNDYIAFITKSNKYIEFNHITGTFDIDIYKFREECRINKILHHSDWTKLIQSYSKNHGIEYIVATKKGILKKEKVVDEEKVLKYLEEVEGETFENYNNGQNDLLDTLRELMGLEPGCKVKSIRSTLDEMDSYVKYYIKDWKREKKINGKRKNIQCYSAIKLIDEH